MKNFLANKDIYILRVTTYRLNYLQTFFFLNYYRFAAMPKYEFPLASLLVYTY